MSTPKNKLKISSSSLPPPPPPPPQIKSSPKNNISVKDIKFESNECIWARQFPELQKAFYLAKVCLNHVPKMCKFLNINTILQNGPTCGLAAVSMLCNGTPNIEILLQKAIELKMTKNGEMFSANNLFELLNCYIEGSDLKINKDRFKMSLYSKTMTCDDLKKHLINDNAAILFAFDIDSNFRPCLRNGTKAHWALIIGSAIDETDQLYIIVRHGKAKNLAVWRMSDVALSNSNLNEVDSEKCGEFFIPIGGIEGKYGLKNQYITILGLENDLINVV